MIVMKKMTGFTKKIDVNNDNDYYTCIKYIENKCDKIFVYFYDVYYREGSWSYRKSINKSPLYTNHERMYTQLHGQAIIKYGLDKIKL